MYGAVREPEQPRQPAKSIIQTNLALFGFGGNPLFCNQPFQKANGGKIVCRLLFRAALIAAVCRTAIIGCVSQTLGDGEIIRNGVGRQRVFG
jgi:hypothetical protein